MSNVNDANLDETGGIDPAFYSSKAARKNKKRPVKRRRLLQREMFKRWNIMWKFRWVKNRSVHDSPMLRGWQSPSVLHSRSILLSAPSQYIATVCLQFSSNPVHHLISLALSTAWLAKQCICGYFMNKSVAINFDYNQKTNAGLKRGTLRCSVITSIFKVLSFRRVMINFFGAPFAWGPWSYRPGRTKEKGPVKGMMRNDDMGGFSRRILKSYYSNWF